MTQETSGGNAAFLLGRLIGRVAELPRECLGNDHTLALSFAYAQVDAILVEELRRVVSGSA